MAGLAKYARRTARPRSARIGTDRQKFPRRAPVQMPEMARSVCAIDTLDPFAPTEVWRAFCWD